MVVHAALRGLFGTREGNAEPRISRTRSDYEAELSSVAAGAPKVEILPVSRGWTRRNGRRAGRIPVLQTQPPTGRGEAEAIADQEDARSD